MINPPTPTFKLSYINRSLFFHNPLEKKMPLLFHFQISDQILLEIIIGGEYWKNSLRTCLFYSFVCEICKQKLLAHLLGDELAHWSYFMTPIYTHINDVICREPNGIYYKRNSISLTDLLIKTKHKPFKHKIIFKI